MSWVGRRDGNDSIEKRRATKMESSSLVRFRNNDEIWRSQSVLKFKSGEENGDNGEDFFNWIADLDSVLLSPGFFFLSSTLFFVVAITEWESSPYNKSFGPIIVSKRGQEEEERLDSWIIKGCTKIIHFTFFSHEPEKKAGKQPTVPAAIYNRRGEKRWV